MNKAQRINIGRERSTIAQWYEFVNEGEALAGTQLGEDVQSYLVRMLDAFTRRIDISERVLAIGLFGAGVLCGSAQRNAFRDMGDTSLLYAGLFPDRRKRLNVHPHYFCEIGRIAYYRVSQVSVTGQTDVFLQLSDKFVQIAETLRAMRRERQKLL